MLSLGGGDVGEEGGEVGVHVPRRFANGEELRRRAHGTVRRHAVEGRHRDAGARRVHADPVQHALIPPVAVDLHRRKNKIKHLVNSYF